LYSYLKYCAKLFLEQERIEKMNLLAESGVA